MAIFLTGSTGYIGAHVAANLLDTHAAALNVLVRARDPQEAQLRLWRALQLHLDFPRFFEYLQTKVRIFCGDLTSTGFGLSRDEYDRLVHTTDSVIHCAASLNRKSEKSCMNVNLRGTFLCCREAFQLMAAQRGGVIINLSSLSGVKGVEKFPGLSAYNVSKSGVAGLTEILAVEGKPYNIRVCAVSPGAVDTEMLRQAAPHLKAGMTPDDLAEILLFLADDSGRMLSGSNVELFTNS